MFQLPGYRCLLIFLILYKHSTSPCCVCVLELEFCKNYIVTWCSPSDSSDRTGMSGDRFITSETCYICQFSIEILTWCLLFQLPVPTCPITLALCFPRSSVRGQITRKLFCWSGKICKMYIWGRRFSELLKIFFLIFLQRRGLWLKIFISV